MDFELGGRGAGGAAGGGVVYCYGRMVMIRRDELVDCADVIVRDPRRLGISDIRELQDAHNVNQCDGCDAWLDDTVPDNGMVSVISEEEFFGRYVY